MEIVFKIIITIGWAILWWKAFDLLANLNAYLKTKNHQLKFKDVCDCCFKKLRKKTIEDNP